MRKSNYEENKLNENRERAEQELIGSTWRILYATYRDTKNVPKKQIDEAEKIVHDKLKLITQ